MKILFLQSMESSVTRYFMQLAYNGSKYFGWQRQPAHASVQQEIEEKLSMIFNEPMTVLGCGRTDTGVHAKDYILHFDTTIPFDENRLVHQLNATLPADIAVYAIYEVPLDWHARFTAIDRSYEYHFHFRKSPFKQQSSWLLKYELNHEAIQEACTYLIGKQDFTSFAKIHTDVNNHFCTITEAKWEYTNEGVVFSITANRFLRNMVRAIVGTLVRIGEGKLTPSDMKNIIAQKNRSVAGQSVPAHGLYLTQIRYPDL